MPEFNPTPDEIAERAAEVRMGWDADTFASRRIGIPKRDRIDHWIPPTVSSKEFEQAINEYLTNGQGNKFPGV